MTQLAPRQQRRVFAGVSIAWQCGDLPVDPFEPVLPLTLDSAPHAQPQDPSAQLTIVARSLADKASDPAQQGGIAMVFHGGTRSYATAQGIVVWDGASLLRISPDGRTIEAHVHASSLQRAFHFSSVTVMMTLLLALRHHGLFHLHAAAARWPSGETWVVPGESGSGKSTLALALFDAGAQWLSDDALLLRACPDAANTGPSVELVGWARMIRMTKGTAAAFPALRELLTPCPVGSARDYEVDPRRAFTGRGIASARAPFTLLFPRIAPAAQSQVTSLDHADAFGRTLHACAWVASEHVPKRAEQLALLARLVDSAAAYELQSGTRLLVDPAAAALQIRALLGSQSPAAHA